MPETLPLSARFLTVALTLSLLACGTSEASLQEAQGADQAQSSAKLDLGLTRTEWVPYGGSTVTPWRRYEKVWPTPNVQGICGGGGWGVWYRFWVDSASPDAIAISSVELLTDSEGQSGSMAVWDVNVYGSNGSQGYRAETAGWAQARYDDLPIVVSPNRSFDHSDADGLPVMLEFKAERGSPGAGTSFDGTSICGSEVAIRLKAYDPFYY